MPITLLDRVQRDIVRSLVSEHPMPWRTEWDWTLEVYDAKDRIVAKLLSLDEYENLLAFAEQTIEEDAAASRRIEALVNDAGCHP